MNMLAMGWVGGAFGGGFGLSWCLWVVNRPQSGERPTFESPVGVNLG